MTRHFHRTAIHLAASAALAVLIFASPAEAAPAVGNGWIRLLPAGLPAAGYFDLHNGGDKSISLTGASSPACGMLMLHRSENVGGTMRMKDVAAVEVPPHAALKFAPGGYHLMCMDPGPALKHGAHVAVTLVFSGGKTLTSDFQVRNAAGK